MSTTILIMNDFVYRLRSTRTRERARAAFEPLSNSLCGFSQRLFNKQQGKGLVESHMLFRICSVYSWDEVIKWIISFLLLCSCRQKKLRFLQCIIQGMSTLNFERITFPLSLGYDEAFSRDPLVNSLFPHFRPLKLTKSLAKKNLDSLCEFI